MLCMLNSRSLLLSLLLLCASVGPLLAAEEGVQKVSHGKEVSIRYILSLDDGTVVASTEKSDPLTYIQGTRAIVPGLERALDGLPVGGTTKVRLAPEEAYGAFDSGKIVEVSKDSVRGDLKVGAMLEGTQASGEVVRSKVLEIKDSSVVLDFNHPMAGKHLTYEVTVVGVRDSAASPKS